MNQIKYNYYIILRPVPFGTLMYDTPNSLSPRTTTGLLLGGHLLLLLSMSQFDQLDQFDQPSMSQFDQFDQFDQPMCASSDVCTHIRQCNYRLAHSPLSHDRFADSKVSDTLDQSIFCLVDCLCPETISE